MSCRIAYIVVCIHAHTSYVIDHRSEVIGHGSIGHVTYHVISQHVIAYMPLRCMFNKKTIQHGVIWYGMVWYDMAWHKWPMSWYEKSPLHAILLGRLPVTLIPGLDYKFTNYMFEWNIEFHPSGKICVKKSRVVVWKYSWWNYSRIPIWDWWLSFVSLCVSESSLRSPQCGCLCLTSSSRLLSMPALSNYSTLRIHS